jgi:pre-rRNA-processing protein TSR3
MIRFGLAKSVSISSIPRGAIILSPFALQALSPADRTHAGRALVVMDLTWTNIEEFPRPKGMIERALPYLIASNPTNWGRPMELNSAEAALASLMILGEDQQAKDLAERFNWGSEFIRINGEMLSDYASAADSTEVVRIQNEYLESIRKDH